jgi:hypothetical protein
MQIDICCSILFSEGDLYKNNKIIPYVLGLQEEVSLSGGSDHGPDLDSLVSNTSEQSKQDQASLEGQRVRYRRICKTGHQLLSQGCCHDTAH